MREGRVRKTGVIDAATPVVWSGVNDSSGKSDKLKSRDFYNLDQQMTLEVSTH